MGTSKKKGSFLALALSCCQLLLLLQVALPLTSQAALDSSNVSPGTYLPSSASVNCAYNFADTYFGAQTATPPNYGATSINWNSAGPKLQLQFGSATAYTNTPAVPCDGYYQVSFSIQIRNDSGMNCRDGLNSMAVWSSTSDPASPNAYGCPSRWYKGHWSGSSWVNETYQLDPGDPYIAFYACNTFNQYVQCAWGNTGQFSNMGSCCGGYGINAYPLFMYTGWWSKDGSNSVYTWNYPYGGFCYSFDRQWGSNGYCQLSNSYAAVKPLQSAYCSSKPFYFKNIVYLHKGATVAAPTLQGLMAQTPYPSSFMGSAQYQVCGVSVIGGKFSVTYLHP